MPLSLRLLLVILCTLASLHAQTIYVDADAVEPTPDGTTWAKAYITLQDALAVATLGDEIWVAEGSYYPDEGAGQTNNDRNASFNLIEGASLYGGFEGTETLRSERDPALHQTILSGDIDQNDNSGGDNSSNAYTVVTVDSSNTSGTTMLDGFTIEAGNNQLGGSGSLQGGGIQVLENASLTVSNCIIRNNTTFLAGGGILVREALASTTIMNCRFENNVADSTRGGAIGCYSGSLVVEGCSFANNTGPSGGAIGYSGSSTLSISNSTFTANSSTTGSGGAVSSISSLAEIYLVNCSFSNNTATSGGGAILSDGTLTAINCSFQGNSSGGDGGAIYHDSTNSLSLINSVIWNNTDTSGTGTANASISSPSSSPVYSHSLVQGITTVDAEGNLDGSTDPLFVSTTDLRLQATSPLIDTGDTSAYEAANGPFLDADGKPRIVPYLPIDIGAYEFQEIIINPELADTYLPIPNGNETVLPDWVPDTSLYNDGNGLQYNFTILSSSITFDSGPSVDPDGTLRFTAPSGTVGSTTCEVIITDPSGALTDSTPVTLTFYVGIIRVDADATAGTENGASWSNALTKLQDAVSKASDGIEIWIAEGTYYPDEGNQVSDGDRSATFDVPAGVSIYGGFDGSESLRSERDPLAHPTILTGDIDQNDGAGFTNHSGNARNLIRVGSGSTSTTVLDGLTITSAYTSGDAGGIYLFDGSLSVKDCIFQENLATGDGSAIYAEDSTLTLTNCSFLSNSGGAIYNTGSALTVEQCLLHGNASGTAIYNRTSSQAGNQAVLVISNTVFDNNSGGGAINATAGSNITISSSSFENNSSASNGGAISVASTQADETILNVSNSTFKGNQASIGGAVELLVGTSTFSNCLFQNNHASTTSAGNGGGAISVIVVTLEGQFAHFTNCTFEGNTATSQGGAISSLLANNLRFENCILWGNSDSSGSGSPSASAYGTSGLPSFSHSIVENSGGNSTWDTALGVDLGGNLDADPLFVSSTDLRLLTGSPALEAGDDSLNTELLDLAGNDRIIGTIDLGAYEGAFVTFAHLGYTNPTADDNGNGISNYGDYAAGGDPTAPDDPTLRPGINGDQLAFSFRNNAADVFTELQKSGTLLPGSWTKMVEGVDYSINDTTVLGGQTIQTLDLLLTDPKQFFREVFSESAE